MSLKRVGSNTDFCPEGLVILENLGVTVYVAQLFERGLQNAITGLERLGAITIPPETTRSGDKFIDTCLGPMLRILESQGTMDRQMSRLLKKAHYQRNLLVHRFLAENIIDMLNEAGRASVNEKLQNIYNNIRLANSIVSQLCDQIWAQLGFSHEEFERQINEWRRLSNKASEDDFLDD
jgi:hypothetical protein